ncbi:MAG: glycosyltransferase [Oscillatoriales cyanobacterium SM2_2_1]|nr:glycosyltransferase [Oscillatoriales cyanobacterium SM2_2_1]
MSAPPPKKKRGFSGAIAPPTLSICLIVKNEASRLERCFRSVIGLPSALSWELIVVDTGSTDRTLAIAKHWGAKTCRFPWRDDFAAARNFSIQCAQGEWILILDADEQLTATAQKELPQAMANTQAIAYQLLRQEQESDSAPYSLITRLFRRRPDLYFSGLYHESVDDALNRLIQQEPHWHILSLPQIALLHDGYRRDRRSQKSDFAHRLMTAHLQQHPHDIYMLTKLGALEVERGNLTAGMALLEQAWQDTQAQRPSAAITFELLYHLGISAEELGQPQRAIAHYHAALEQPIADVLKLPAYVNLATLAQHQGANATAIAHYQTALSLDPTHAPTLLNLGITYRQANDLGRAIATYQQLLHHHPHHALGHQNLGVAYWHLGHIPEAITAWRQSHQFHLEQGHSQAATQLAEHLNSLGVAL